MTMSDNRLVKEAVREHYAKVALGSEGCCGDTGCCGPSASQAASILSRVMGYSNDELQAVPEGANLGLGCGNPLALAGLKPGEIVVDLGSGAGFDAFIAAGKVGPTGKVYGVDMTDEMLAKARANAARGGFSNVEFLKGEIENLPLPDASVDVIISNCVINLSPDKKAVFREVARVLRPGGRVEVSDVVALEELPEEARRDADLISACIGGAALIDDLRSAMEEAGLEQISIEPQGASITGLWGLPDSLLSRIDSAHIKGTKPLQ
jgi:SAM-dependent methyltransferase